MKPISSAIEVVLHQWLKYYFVLISIYPNYSNITSCTFPRNTYVSPSCRSTLGGRR